MDMTSFIMYLLRIMSIGQNSPTTNRLPRIAQSQHVMSGFIQPVPLQLGRYALLADKYRLPYRAQQKLRIVPSHRMHRKIHLIPGKTSRQNVH